MIKKAKSNNGFRILGNISKTYNDNDIIVHHANFLKLMMQIESVDLIITSPPYNIGVDYGVYDDNRTYKEYLNFSKQWLAKCISVLKGNGRLCINVPLDTGRNGKRSIAADLTILAKRAGFKYKGTIVWNKQNVKNKYSMVFSKNIEVILIFYKEEWEQVSSEFREWVNEIWQFSGENPRRVRHPAAFPIELPKRLIKMFSKVSDVVLDTFVGSGTTMIAAEQLFRKGIGVEIDKTYFELTKKRIKEKIW